MVLHIYGPVRSGGRGPRTRGSDIQRLRAIDIFAVHRSKLRTEPADLLAGIIVGFLLFESVVLPTPSRWVARNSLTTVIRHGGQKM